MTKSLHVRLIFLIFSVILVPNAVGAQFLNAEIQCNVLATNQKSTSNMVVDFNDPKEWSLWRSLNDGVMGGKSQGGMTASQGHGIFTGYISLANNGGFSSVVRDIKPLIPAVDSLVIDVAGDGLTYQLRAIVYINGYRLAYKHDFSTVNRKRKQSTLLLSDFQASFRGRILSDAPPLLAKNITEIGLLVTSKNERQFTLNIFSISGSCANSSGNN
jgi:hypothetical protein